MYPGEALSLDYEVPGRGISFRATNGVANRDAIWAFGVQVSSC